MSPDPNVTKGGTMNFVTTGGQIGQTGAMSALGAKGGSQATLNFGGGLTATAQAYTASSTGGPSINLTFHQTHTPTGSRIQRTEVVGRVKIRFTEE